MQALESIKSVFCCRKAEYLDVSDHFTDDPELLSPEEGPTCAQLLGKSLQWVGGLVFFSGASVLWTGIGIHLGQKSNETASGFGVSDTITITGAAALTAGGILFKGGTVMLAYSNKSNAASVDENLPFYKQKNA